MPRKKPDQPDPRFARAVLIRVPEVWHEELRTRSFNERRPISELVREAVKDHFSLPCDCGTDNAA